MSAIKVQANTNGIGTVTLTAPNTNTDRTVTIPDVSGNVVISDGSLITADYTSSSLTFGGTVDFTSATVKGLGSWKIQNANNITLVAGDNVFANTRAGALTLNLPASATKGETIRIIDNEGLCSSNNITIGRNGHNIDGSARNAVLNVDRQGIVLVYESSRNGWVSKKKERESRVSGTQGEIFGYSSQGFDNPGSIYGQIEKYSFSVDGNGIDVGDLATDREQGCGQSSLTHGYTGTGFVGPVLTGDVEKFPFATDGNATSVLTLSVARGLTAGQSSQTHGYTSGGYSPGVNFRDIIDKFPFATDANASDVGNLSTVRFGPTGQSSLTHGYVTGGQNLPGKTNIIEKFPFATDTNAVDVGDLVEARNTGAGQNSEEFGYMSSGNPSSTGTNRIDKYPFASDNNATDVGDTTQARLNLSGSSSTVSGYSHGGSNPPIGTPDRSEVIDKFPFASDANATDVGNMFQKASHTAGHQS